MFKSALSKVIFLSTIVFNLSACHVVDLDENGKPIIPMSSADAALFKNMSVKAITEKLWPTINKDARDKAIFLSEIDKSRPMKIFVKFHGIVSQFNDSAMKKSLVVESDDDKIELQVGSIIRGNSIRDAISFISFDQFKNQIQFAHFSKELNKKAVSNIAQPFSSWKGKKVDVLAAITVKGNEIIDAVPLEIKAEDQ